MNEEGQPAGGVEVGLCLTCAHSRVVTSERGGRFYLCRMSQRDPSFPRYPRLPVRACRGYERRSDAEG